MIHLPPEPPADSSPRASEKPPMIPRSRQFIAILVVLLAINLVISFVTGGPEDRERIPYQPFFVDQVEAGNVSEISSQEESIEGELANEATYDPPGDAEPVKVTKFETEVPAFIDPAELTRLLSSQDVVINAEPPDTGRSIWFTLLLGFLPTILLVGFFVWIYRRQMGQGGGGVLGGFGRSTARRVTPGEQERVTFEDVAGIDEAEDELVEVVDFLKNPERYTKLGARIPRGVLLYGPPGTGKTLLARAVAGEADAAFFSLSASEFVEAIVGVGASRVRDLFKQAKEAAPAIVFIDELDAIGRSRSGNVGGISGGHDEREQTLNQILTEMDGFDAGHERDRPRGDEPPRDPRPGAAAPGPLRPPHRRPAARPPGPRGDPEDPHPLGAARARRRPRPDRRLDAGRDRRRHRAARQRGGAVRRPPRPQGGRAARLHRRDREDHPRHRAPGGDDRRRPRAHRLPRVRPRARRHAHPRRRPGAEDLDHPPRPGARRHPLDPGERPLQLRPRRADREDQGRARRARGGEGRSTAT